MRGLQDLHSTVDGFFLAGAAEVLEKLKHVAPTQCVRGNVDEGASHDAFPLSRHLEFLGWRILLTHIVGMPPKVTSEARELVKQSQADIVVFGHSHKAGCERHDGVLYVNPGSAGPARFKLTRSVAILDLPAKETGAEPEVSFTALAAKAPPRLLAETRKAKRRRL